jgi:hypothetical protein
MVRLRDMIALVLGVAVVIAPWFNGDDVTTHGAIRLRVVAFAVCAVSLWIIVHQRDIVAEVVNAALGLALITAPCWRGGLVAQSIDNAVAGAIVFVFSATCVVAIARERRASRSGRIPFRAPHPFSNN